MLVIYLEQSICSISNNQYSILVDIGYSRCDNDQPYLILNGQEIFKSSDSSVNTVNKITLSGWFLFRGYNGFIYPLFTLYSQNDLLLRIGYQIKDSQIIYSKLISSVQSFPFPSIQKNNWYFLYSKIIYQSDQVTLETNVETASQIIFTSTPQNQPYDRPFKKSDIILKIGDFSSNNDVIQSCSFSRNIKIYWDDSFTNPRSYFNDFLQFNSRLQSHFDFYYYQSNNGYLQNVEEPMNNLQIRINDEGSFQIQAKQFFLTDFLNIFEQSGFLISFHIKISNQSLQNKIQILIIKLITETINIEILKNGEIEMKSNKITGIQLNAWIQVTLIIKINNLMEIFLLVKGYENQVLKIILPLGLQSQLPQLQFGSIDNQDSFILNNLRIYKGAFLTQNNSNNCFLQDSKNQCIICNTGQLIDYQNQNQCVTPSSNNISTLVNDVRDWIPTRLDCPSSMIIDPQTNECRCRFQYYLSNNECLKCPNYCKGCYDINNCIKQDPLRLVSGQCPIDTFDDGYTCLKNKLKISSFKNKQIYHPTLYNLGDNCNQSIDSTLYQANNDTLALTGKDSFFYSFTYKSQLPIYQRGSIWYLKDENTELFTVMYNRTSIPLVEFFAQGTWQHYFLVNDDEPVWIGIWSNLQEAIFMVHTNGQLLYKKFIVNIQISYVNPYVCLGPCLSAYDNNYYCGNAGFLPQLFIQNMRNPTDDIMELQNLIYLQINTLATFKAETASPINNGKFQDTSSGLILDFQNSPVYVDKYKGFGINELTYAVINGVNIQSSLPTFFTAIYIDKIQYQTQLVQYSPKVGFTVEYYLVPYGTKVLVRICIYETVLDCKDSNYSMLNMQERNQIIIIPRLRSFFSIDFTYYEFEVVCNYQREQIKFLLAPQPFLNTPISINIAKQTVEAGNFYFYMNNIQLDQGNGSYYFDYSAEERCFLFKNISNLTCLITKKGYLSYRGIIITEEECKEFTKIYKKLFYINKETSECIELNLDSNCSQPDITTNPISCKQCLYENALLSNGCLCPDGTYADKKQLKCIPCNIKCKLCEGQSDNCLACQSLNQIPPKCGCIQENMYEDQNGKCQYCSFRCTQCDTFQNNCIKCAEKRTNPPECGCDLLFYKEQNGICQDFICQSKCQFCQTNPDYCTSCKYGRSNPPLCDCNENHYPESDGTCSPCPNSYFFDKSTNSCQQCEKPCLQCINNKDQCLECVEGLKLQDSSCICNSQELVAVQLNGSSTCLKEMDVQLKVLFKQSYYQLVFIFTQNLMEIDFSNPKRLNQLIEMTLSEIPSKEYELINPYLHENKLYMRLHVKSNFQCRFGQVRFLDNSKFISFSLTHALVVKYLDQPIIFELGPYLFTDDILDQKDVGVLIDSMKNEHQQLLNAVQQTQFIFYFLNTVQPTLLFFLLKLNFPPNLYTFYQVFGIMVFPDAVDYQTLNYKDTFKIITAQLDNNDVTLINQLVYKRIGLSNSFLTNAPFVIIKYIIMIFLILLLKMIIFCVSFSKKTKEKLTNLNYLIIQRINSENETNLLLLSLTILLQLANVNQDQWAARYGYYLSIIFLIMFAISFYYNLKELNNQNTKIVYSTIFIERLKEDGSFFSRNYFLIQMLKKYCVIIILFVFREIPLYACLINGVLFFLSCLQTFILKPYKLILSRIIKILGEFTLSVCWFIHIYILKIEKDLQQQTFFDQQKVEKYLNLGDIVILMLLVFNIIFLIEYAQKLVILTKKLLNKDKKADIQKLQINKQQIPNFSSLNKSILKIKNKEKTLKEKYIASFLPAEKRKLTINF